MHNPYRWNLPYNWLKELCYSSKKYKHPNLYLHYNLIHADNSTYNCITYHFKINKNLQDINTVPPSARYTKFIF